MGLIKHNAQAHLALESLLIWEFGKSNALIIGMQNGWIKVFLVDLICLRKFDTHV